MIYLNGTLITVSQLNKYIRSILDDDNNLKNVFVSGEISNLKINSFSGHIYFSLKDEGAAVRSVMFKSNAVNLKFLPQDGMKVICRGYISVYEKEGQYQLYITELQPDGAGSIALAFQQLKEKLLKEGVFNNNRPLPKFPKKIAVITSATGAAVHDMLTILERRWPIASVVLCPVSVQGDLAANQIIKAINDVNNCTDCDLIIVGRGGGSVEDLWCFNDEQLARNIYASNIPVISAVGHETDFTICDFAADLRAPTPSAAAELAVPDINEFVLNIKSLNDRAYNAMFSKYNRGVEVYNILSKSKVICDKNYFTEMLSIRLDNLYSKLTNSFSNVYSETSVKLINFTSKLDALNPAKTLLRGYAIAEKDGKAVKTVDSLSENDSLDLILSDGKAECVVKSVERNA